MEVRDGEGDVAPEANHVEAEDGDVVVRVREHGDVEDLRGESRVLVARCTAEH